MAGRRPGVFKQGKGALRRVQGVVATPPENRELQRLGNAIDE
jgi:hypothetical protein